MVRVGSPPSKLALFGMSLSVPIVGMTCAVILALTVGRIAWEGSGRRERASPPPRPRGDGVDSLDESLPGRTIRRPTLADPRTVEAKRRVSRPIATPDAAVDSNDASITCDRPYPHDASEVAIPEFYRADSGCSHALGGSVAFFHVGKAGGGTVDHELRRYRIDVLRSHPDPRPSHVRGLGPGGPLRTLILNVRDPVDRYASAFRWATKTRCHPRSTTGHYCNDDDPAQEEMLRVRYASDPNNLAEALCEESPTRGEAVRDHDLLQHAKWTLARWIGFLLDPAEDYGAWGDDGAGGGIRELLVLPLEAPPGDDGSRFERQVRRLLSALLRSRYAEGTAEEILRRAPPDDARQRERMRHATTLPASTPSSTLSALGECCVARHLVDDYRLLRTMMPDAEDVADVAVVEPLEGVHPVVRDACAWGDEEGRARCRFDLRSMLLRRAGYLDRSRGTCSEIAGNGIDVGR